MNEVNTLLVEKYRPKDLSEYIGNDQLKEKISIFIKSNDVPNLLLYGKAGTGKTSIAKIIAKLTDCDYLYINASDENSVDVMRNKIKDFASGVGFKKFKLIILDESEFLSMSSQATLRGILETYSRNTRFILTCNYVEKIIEPIQSRCQVFNIVPPSKNEVVLKMEEILNKEKVKYKKENILTIVNSCYPDIRKSINTLQQHIVNKELVLDNISIIQSDYKSKLLEHLINDTKPNAFRNIRQLIADSKVSDFTDLYRILYDNIENFAKGHIANTILIIAEYQYMDSLVVDKEINIMAMIIKILNEIKS